MLGREGQDCRRKNKVRQEWSAVQQIVGHKTVTKDITQPPDEQGDNDSFTLPRRLIHIPATK